MKLGEVKQNIMVLAISNLTIGIIEFLFNIYLARFLGAEGLGVLSLISPINCLFLSFMTEGIVVTMSKSSARLYSLGDFPGIHTSIKIATIASFLWSLFLGGILLITAPLIAEYFLGDKSLVYPIWATCPLMLLMSISNIVKGHFLGMSKIKIPSLINIGEKLLRFPILFALIGIFLNKTTFPSVTLVYLCYALGEMQSVLLLLIYYRLQPEGKTLSPSPSIKKEFLNVLLPLTKGAAPICLTQCLFELVNALSSLVVKTRLISAGFTSSEALSLLGKYRGMVFPLMSYPMILVGAACSVVIPKISTMLFSGKSKHAGRLLKRTLLFTGLIGLFTCTLCQIFADDFGRIFYGREDLGLMIRLGGLCSPIVYIGTATSNLLISLGREIISFRNSMVQQLLLLFILYVFTGIPFFNIYSYYVAITLSTLVLVIMNGKELKDILRPR